MTETADANDARRAWLGEDRAGLSAARGAKHALADQVRRLIDATFQVDVGDVGYGDDGREPGICAELERLTEAARQLADRVGALPRIPRATSDEGLHASQARRYDALLVERSTINGRGNPLAPPVRMWADGDLVRAEAVFTAAYEGPPGRVHGAWVAACFDEILGCAQGVSGAFGFTGTLTVRMRRATPLYERIEWEAGFTRREGRKLFGWGRCSAGGMVTAEAEGIFIVPAWADRS
jgi:acyl-coenzyme A thioesterase PaaI-like protein